MKNKEIILIIIFYLFTIEETFRFFYFPNSALSIIHREFLPYALIVKIIMILIAFSLIPGFYIIRKAYKGRLTSEFENRLIKLIMGFSIIPPLMALLNNFTTADFLFSIGLIIYGVLFTVIAFILRDLGNDNSFVHDKCSK